MKNAIGLFFYLLSIPLFGFAQNDSIGVYYQTDNGLAKIEPIQYSQTKTSTLGATLTMGIAGSKIKTVYKGSSSKNITGKSPVFYFYYKKNIPFDMIKRYYMFYSSSTPTDILLARFNSKKKTRELQVGKVNTYTGITLGTANDLNVETKIERVKDGVYKITFDQPLDVGEYCFLFNAPNGSGAYMSVFDFSVN